MVSYFRFENLEVWKLSREFVSRIYSETKHFPESEKFGLTLQVRRAALSITLNITEGSDRKSDREFIRFLLIALGSLEEVVAGMYVALDQQFITREKFDILYDASHVLKAKLNALINTLNAAEKQKHEH